MNPADPQTALIVIDMQRDFLPGGPLGVPGGDALVPGIETLAQRFAHVILTADWHPNGHISFASSHDGKRVHDTVEAAYGTQVLWPEHCVQGTAGAAFAVNIPHAEMILHKGFRRNIDSYSAFLENDHRTSTGLAGYLRDRGLRRLVFCGLATDFCVGSSAVDGAAMGFDCAVLEDLSRPVNLPATGDRPGSLAAMHSRFAAGGVRVIHSRELEERPPQ